MPPFIPTGIDPVTNKELRGLLRRRRLNLSPREQQLASLAITERIARLPEFRRARHIAAYVGNKGEIDPMPLLHLAHAMNKHCYLPVLHPFLGGRLWFVPWTPGTPMQLNRFDIPEPLFEPRAIRKPRWLDLVVTPLLGFDEHCHRLGMGGGFYDRTFAHKRRLPAVAKPCLLGVAHDVQRCESISTAPWDVRLDGIVTPSRCYRCATGNA